MYATGEEGFHRVATLVHDFPAAKRYFLDQGFEVACELWTGGVDAAYFDTRSVNGGFTEIHGDPPYILETSSRTAGPTRGTDPEIPPCCRAARAHHRSQAIRPVTADEPGETRPQSGPPTGTPLGCAWAQRCASVDATQASELASSLRYCSSPNVAAVSPGCR